MKILMLTTYYYPHVSGLTLYFQRLAEDLAAQKHQVTLLSARHDKSLAKYEIRNGVQIIRTRPLLKLNKGLLLPFILLDAFAQLRSAEVVHLNLPSTEALPVALLARILGKKVVSTYVCDITLPVFWGSKIFNLLVDILHRITLHLSQHIVSFTLDYAQHSRTLKPFINRTVAVYPHITLTGNATTVAQLQRIKTQNTPLIGMATRVAAEKGVDLILEVFPELRNQFPKLALVVAGDKQAIGEHKYWQKLQPLITQNSGQVFFLDKLSTSELIYFYQNIDVLLVASTNSTEAFGMVQAEAMQFGTPVVASDLPGVRVPVQATAMGEIFSAGNTQDMLDKLLEVLNNKQKYLKPKSQILNTFQQNQIVEQYLAIYKS